MVTKDGEVTTTDFTYTGLTLRKLSGAKTQGETSESWSITYLYDEYGKPYAGVYRDTTGVPANWPAPVVFGLVITDRGDVVSLLDANGDPFAAYRYDAWGSPLGPGTDGATGMWWQATASITDANLAKTISERQVLRYAGYCFDSESGLYYLSARHYDPTTRQFLSKDLSRNDGEQSAYQYCLGNPVGLVDPTGLRTWGMDLVQNAVARARSVVSWRTFYREERYRQASESAQNRRISGTAGPNVGVRPSDRGAITVPFPRKGDPVGDMTLSLAAQLVTDMGRLLDMQKSPDQYPDYSSGLGGRNRAQNFFWKQVDRHGVWDMIDTPTGHGVDEPIFKFNDVEMSLEQWGNYAIGARAVAAGVPLWQIKEASQVVEFYRGVSSLCQGKGFPFGVEDEAIDQVYIELGYSQGQNLMKYVEPCQQNSAWRGYGP